MPKSGTATWYLEFGSTATIETLYSVPTGSRFLGTFDREEAVARESLDFFASGHTLVEAILAELSDGTRGQLALFELPGSGFEGVGVLSVVKTGAQFEISVHDLHGSPRQDWKAALVPRLGDVVEIRAALWTEPGWDDAVRRVFSRFDPKGDLAAVAGVRLSR